MAEVKKESLRENEIAAMVVEALRDKVLEMASLADQIEESGIIGLGDDAKKLARLALSDTVEGITQKINQGFITGDEALIAAFQEELSDIRQYFM